MYLNTLKTNNRIHCYCVILLAELTFLILNNKYCHVQKVIILNNKNEFF